MNYAPLAVVGLFIMSLLAIGGTSHAFEQKDLEKLERSGSCDGCDLSNAYLKQSDLRGASLVKANLREAELKAANLSGANIKASD